MTYDAELAEVLCAMMTEPVLSAEDQLERRVDFLIRELDELMAMAANHETVDLIQNERRSLGMVKTRVDLILSFLMATQPPKLKMVQNNG